MSEPNRWRTSYHEAGHFVFCWYHKVPGLEYLDIDDKERGPGVKCTAWKVRMGQWLEPNRIARVRGDMRHEHYAQLFLRYCISGPLSAVQQGYEDAWYDDKGDIPEANAVAMALSDTPDIIIKEATGDVNLFLKQSEVWSSVKCVAERAHEHGLVRLSEVDQELMKLLKMKYEPREIFPPNNHEE